MDKNIIKREIVPLLSSGKSGPWPKVPIESIVAAILYRLKTGCQWRELPMRMFFRKRYSYQSVYHHFRKWCSDGSWQKLWINLLAKYRHRLNLSSVQLDGSHTIVKRGGVAVGYQRRKKAQTTNMLYLVDDSGTLISCSEAVSGEHHDLWSISEVFEQLCAVLQKANIAVDGLFLNADAAFDCKQLRQCCEKKQIIANIPQNPRSSHQKDRDQYFDELLYRRRIVAEHAFAWMDSCKALLIRFETKAHTWLAMNILGMVRFFLKRITRKKTPQGEH